METANPSSKLTRLVGWIGLGGMVVMVAMSVTHLGKGTPSTRALVPPLIVSAILLYLIYEKPTVGRPLTCWFWAGAIPLLAVEPFVTGHIGVGVAIPTALAMVLAGPRTLIGVMLLSLGVFAARAPAPLASPYLDPTFLAMTGLLTALMLVAQHSVFLSSKEVRRAAGRFEAITRDTNDVVLITGAAPPNENPPVEFVSPTIERLLGYAPEDFKSGAVQMLDLVHPDDAEDLAASRTMVRAAPGTSGAIEFRARHKSGDYRWLLLRSTNLLGHALVKGVVSTLHDVSQAHAERRLFAEQLEHQAMHDPLTLLPNRRMLLRRTEAFFDAARIEPKSLAILFCDLDGFKVVNDSMGHDLGDSLLVAVTARLVQAVGEKDLVARFGGDEFVVLAEEIDAEQARSLGEAIITALAEPIAVGQQRLVVTGSVGIAMLGAHQRPEELIRDADLAMYRAKERGRNRVEIFDEEMRRRALRRHEIEQSLRRAIDRGEITVAFQPRVAARSRHVLGFEALARWRHPTLGNVPPDEFIKVAEETALISALGAQVLRSACRELAVWRTQHPDLDLHVAVNISGRQLAEHEALEDEVARIIEETGIPTSSLELEVTESILLGQDDRSVEILERIRRLGVRIAVDDFGTGYSSLAYLRRFPVDCVKVERTFVKNLTSTDEDRTIVEVIMLLAKTLELTTVAEGIETEEQATLIAQMGCEQLQGFLIAHPMTSAETLTYLKNATPPKSLLKRA